MASRYDGHPQRMVVVKAQWNKTREQSREPYWWLWMQNKLTTTKRLPELYPQPLKIVRIAEGQPVEYSAQQGVRPGYSASPK